MTDKRETRRNVVAANTAYGELRQGMAIGILDLVLEGKVAGGFFLENAAMPRHRVRSDSRASPSMSPKCICSTTIGGINGTDMTEVTRWDWEVVRVREPAV